MTGSIRSNKVIKQEEEQPQADQNGVASFAEAAPPRPRTSLLSLPDDLLLLIYEELYEDQYGAKTISPPVSEILINKRIFNILQPLWNSRLSIDETQLDLRLSEILNQPERRQVLHRLQLTFSSANVHLIRVVLSNLRLLSHLSLNIVNSISTTAIEGLVEGLKNANSLTHLVIRSKICAPSDHSELIEAGYALFGHGLQALENHFNERMVWRIEQMNGFESVRYGPVPSFDRVDWTTVISFEKINYWHCADATKDFMESLERGITQNPDNILPLKRFALDVDSRPLRAGGHPDRMSSKTFTKLLHLLSLTQIERLELNLATWIPRVLSEQQVPTLKSLRSLRVSGPCSFAAESNFSAFSNLLLNLPSLTQLHLEGSNFFGKDLSADKMSKLELFQLFASLPHLAALLACLRTTKVKIFTYRGAEEKREIRWTRLSAEEDFARECWTLSDQGSSMKQVKEEEAGDGASLEAAERVPPRSQPSSLLSLPDDLLLPIYEELYEEQYGDKITSAPVSEILVNKRLFNLFLPLWISRLSINSSQLDRRLAALLVDPLRLSSIRWFMVPFPESLAHLIKMTISRLASLTKLTVLLPGLTPYSTQSILIDGLKASPSLTELELLLEGDYTVREIASIERHFEEQLGTRHLCFKLFSDVYASRRYSTQQGGVARFFLNAAKDDDFEVSNEDWSVMRSFESADILQSPGINEVLSCFERVFTRNLEITGTNPLNHLALQVRFESPEERSDREFFTPENFTALFRLLSLTKLERLELKQLTWIPPVLEQHLVPSVQLLRLSGPCRLASEDNFQKLSLVLLNLPSLSQLHLVGSNFFHDDLNADTLSKLEGIQIAFRFPLLGSLLGYLRSTKVKIFTYKGQREKREMRWTRISTDEDFERDCWTL
ncbi:hypothetical protein JCM3765_006998 [Sporobolomyces pararoseus]